MKSIVGSKKREPFSFSLASSFLFHIAVLLLLILLSYFETTPMPSETKVTWIQLGASGKGEGLPIKETKTLPQTTLEEQKKATYEQPPPDKDAKKNEKAPSVVDKNKVVVNDKNKSEKKVEAKEKTKESDERIRKPKVEDKRIKDALAKINEDLKSSTPVPEAAQVKEGGQGSPLGEPGGNNSACGSYSVNVKRRIVGNWIRIVGANKPLRPPIISATISPSGAVTSTRWVQKSGDFSLDQSALRSIESSSPLPVPPENCEAALRGGITLQFGR